MISTVSLLVTFETLAARFSLGQDPALQRLVQIIHSLGVGDLPVLEAAGPGRLLTGIRARAADDDTLLKHARSIFVDHYPELQQEAEST